MLKTIASNIKEKFNKKESGNDHVLTTSSTEITTTFDDPPTTTIKTTTTTDIFSPGVTSDENDNTDETVQSLSVTFAKQRIGTISHQENVVTTTIQEQPQGDVTVDTLESSSIISYTDDISDWDEDDFEPDSLEETLKIYPGTINAKFVRDQSHLKNIHGLKHALAASIDKSSPSNEGRLFDGGILTNANHKKWYYLTLPVNWIQKFSSEHNFGNYVVSNRLTGEKAWEDMPIYARIGMHLLFATMVDRKLLKTHKIRHLFSVQSVNQGKHFDAPESVAQINHFIKTFKLDLSELLQPNIKDYKSFNEFFYRRLRPDARPIHELENPNIIVSSADCRLCVFESISSATQVWIKGKSFTVKNLVQDETLASQFEGGSIAIFRLAPQDYHRFHSPVTGTIANNAAKIDGTYFTVNPMAVNRINVFTENVRQVSIIDLEQQGETKNQSFDQCVYVSIGALLVGSIVLTGAKEQGTRVQKGDELGYFAYGGSTCILLFKEGAVQFDEDLVDNSLKGIETLVRVGECIGERQ
ncbi:hypothetical protein BGZ76_001806 [Entomortierella beljakovae]|nr:hypothetical protein BGZ76_001806 [Entomortierella beljakovae]